MERQKNSYLDTKTVGGEMSLIERYHLQPIVDPSFAIYPWFARIEDYFRDFGVVDAEFYRYTGYLCMDLNAMAYCIQSAEEDAFKNDDFDPNNEFHQRHKLKRVIIESNPSDIEVQKEIYSTLLSIGRIEQESEAETSRVRLSLITNWLRENLGIFKFLKSSDNPKLVRDELATVEARASRWKLALALDTYLSDPQENEFLVGNMFDDFYKPLGSVLSPASYCQLSEWVVGLDVKPSLLIRGIEDSMTELESDESGKVRKRNAESFVSDNNVKEAPILGQVRESYQAGMDSLYAYLADKSRLEDLFRSYDQFEEAKGYMRAASHPDLSEVTKNTSLVHLEFLQSSRAMMLFNHV